MAGHTTGDHDDSNDEEKQLPTTSDSDSVLSSASFQNLEPASATRSRGRQGSVREKAASAANPDDAVKTANDAAPRSLREPDSAATQPGPPEESGQGAAPEEGRTKLQTGIIVAALCSAVFLAALDVTIVTVAIPTISEDFNSSAGYTWIGSAYLLANAAAVPAWGKFSDIFGRKPILLTAVLIFWVGSLICGLSRNMAMLIVGRAIQGIGGGGSLVLVNITISDLFSMRKRGVYLGFVGLVWAVAGGFGPDHLVQVLGGVFTTKATWRWCFYINLPVAGLAFIVLCFALKLHNPRTPILEGLAVVDWLGSLTIVGGTLMFLLGLEMGGNTFPWTSPTVICLLVFGVVVASMCVFVETYIAKYPLIPVRTFKSTQNMAIIGLCVCHGFAFISVSFYMPLYFQGVLGASALLSGVYVLPYTITLGLTSAVVGLVIKKTGKYLPSIIGGFALTVLGYGLFINLDSYANWPKIILYQIILGLGIGPNFQSPLIALQSAVQPREVASATGTFMFVRQLSTSISIVVGGVIFNNGMQKQYSTLLEQLGPQTAGLLTGNNAAASVDQVTALPEPQRGVAQRAYWDALQTMFIFYVAFAGLGFIISFFVGGRVLSKEHTEFKTGLQNLQPGNKPIADEEKQTASAGGNSGGSETAEAAANNSETGPQDKKSAAAESSG